LCGAETWTLRKVGKKYLESFEIWCRRRMEKIIWINHVRNEEVLHRVKEERKILHTIKSRKANWVGHSLRRNCLKKIYYRKIEGGVEVMRRERRGCKELLDDLKEGTGSGKRKQ
jgi:hypothetical protein